MFVCSVLSESKLTTVLLSRGMNLSVIAWFTSDVFSRSVNSVRATGNLLTQEPAGPLQKPFSTSSEVASDKGKLTQDDEKTDT